jgi:hypothetical protein
MDTYLQDRHRGPDNRLDTLRFGGPTARGVSRRRRDRNHMVRGQRQRFRRRLDADVLPAVGYTAHDNDFTLPHVSTQEHHPFHKLRVLERRGAGREPPAAARRPAAHVWRYSDRSL